MLNGNFLIKFNFMSNQQTRPPDSHLTGQRPYNYLLNRQGMRRHSNIMLTVPDGLMVNVGTD